MTCIQVGEREIEGAFDFDFNYWSNWSPAAGAGGVCT